MEELLKGLQLAFERQRRLTGDAAHELKTSIAVLKSSLQLLSMAPRTAEQYEAGLEGLLLDSERMEELVSRMLTLARLEEAAVEQSASCDLQSVVREVAERLRPLAELKHVVLEVSAAEARAVAMHTDDAELLCSNLIVNALQHSAANGRVSVHVRALDGVTELRVADRGDGIPASALPHVFERFFRADRSRSRASGGAGLGLSICKAIVERVRRDHPHRERGGNGHRGHGDLPRSTNFRSTLKRLPRQAEDVSAKQFPLAPRPGQTCCTAWARWLSVLLASP